jgi:hypothetical protein
LLSHIKAPAQGGKAGDGKPSDAKCIKQQNCQQVSLGIFQEKMTDWCLLGSASGPCLEAEF